MPEVDWLGVAREILRAVGTPTLATAGSDGTPRAVIVGGELKDGKLYWRSWPSRRHSKQVAENPMVAFNFFDAPNRRAVYGVGRVDSVEPDGEFSRYFATVTELWVVSDEQVEGQYMPPMQVDPKAL